VNKIFFTLLLICLFGCSTVQKRTPHFAISTAEYTELNEFCATNSLTYQFDTVDDIIYIYSAESDMTLLLDSLVGIFSGKVLPLPSPPINYQGKILIPNQITEISTYTKKSKFTPTLEVKTIVIDPGHGGKDPGAISKGGLKEKEVNLKISKYLKIELEKRGFSVFLTRSTDVYISLAQRVNFAKKCNADLFLSLHANANNSSGVKGIEIYYLLPSRVNSLSRSLKLIGQECFPGEHMPKSAKIIFWDLLINKNYCLSVELSDKLYDTFKKFNFNVKFPKKAPFYVLRLAYVPSVLVEVGYLTNHYEEKALRKKYYQKQLAETIALGIVSLKESYMNR